MTDSTFERHLAVAIKAIRDGGGLVKPLDQLNSRQRRDLLRASYCVAGFNACPMAGGGELDIPGLIKALVAGTAKAHSFSEWYDNGGGPVVKGK